MASKFVFWLLFVFFPLLAPSAQFCVCHKVTAPAFLSPAGDGSDDYFDLSISCPLLLLALLLRPC